MNYGHHDSEDTDFEKSLINMARCATEGKVCDIFNKHRKLSAAALFWKGRTMTTKIARNPSWGVLYPDVEPLPDPPYQKEMQQFKPIYLFASVLSARFAGRGDVLISGAGYLCRSRSDLNPLFVPDGIFTKGVADPNRIIARNGYVIDEVGKPPDLVLEVASRSTGRRDYTVKREGYALFGVAEYWRFDTSGGKYHDAALAGDRLVGGKYEPIEIHKDAEGLLWGYSAVLELHICWDDGELRFRDPATMEFLLSNAEAHAELDDIQTELGDAHAELDLERERRLAAEAEATRLREQLRRLR